MFFDLTSFYAACFRVLGIEGDSGGSRDRSGSEILGRGQRDMGAVRMFQSTGR